jgi:ubiquinone/menaquinone biosynthesis C-methylase UbiE
MLQNHIWEPMFQGEFGKYPGENLIIFIAKNFYKLDRKTIRILEVGCGPGANVWYVSREGFDAYGIDGSPTAIETAKKRLHDENLKASLIVGDINKLPYEDNYFDAVIDNECIYSNTLNDTNLILSEINRVLKSGGLFYSRTFADDMHVGKDAQTLGYLEYKEATEGPIAKTGYFRLTDRKVIQELYGKYFEQVTIDKMTYTRNNGAFTVSEWIIINRKKAIV